MDIYIAPEALEVAEQVYQNAYTAGGWGIAGPVCVRYRQQYARVILQWYVENPRQLTTAESRKISSAYFASNTHYGEEWHLVFKESLRVAFTKPAPPVPEKIVLLIDQHTAKATQRGGWTTDMIREFAVQCYAAKKEGE